MLFKWHMHIKELSPKLSNIINVTVRRILRSYPSEIESGGTTRSVMGFVAWRCINKDDSDIQQSPSAPKIDRSTPPVRRPIRAILCKEDLASQGGIPAAVTHQLVIWIYHGIIENTR